MGPPRLPLGKTLSSPRGLLRWRCSGNRHLQSLEDMTQDVRAPPGNPLGARGAPRQPDASQEPGRRRPPQPPAARSPLSGTHERSPRPLTVGTLQRVALFLTPGATTARPKALDPKRCGPDAPGHQGALRFLPRLFSAHHPSRTEGVTVTPVRLQDNHGSSLVFGVRRQFSFRYSLTKNNAKVFISPSCPRFVCQGATRRRGAGGR